MPPPDMTPVIIASLSQSPIETGSSGQYREPTVADTIAVAGIIVVWIATLILAAVAAWVLITH
jgi:hypothetical protein